MRYLLNVSRLIDAMMERTSERERETLGEMENQKHYMRMYSVIVEELGERSFTEITPD